MSQHHRVEISSPQHAIALETIVLRADQPASTIFSENTMGFSTKTIMFSIKSILFGIKPIMFTMELPGYGRGVGRLAPEVGPDRGTYI